MYWTLTGGSLVSSAELAVLLFVGLAMFSGFNWRTGMLAVIAVVAVNVFYPDGAYGLLSSATYPLQVANTNSKGCQRAAMEEERRHPYHTN